MSKTLLTAVRPSGELTLGNYLGAIKQFKKLSESGDFSTAYLFIADLHGITSPQPPAEIKEAIQKCVAIYLACGVSPEKVVVFQQSSVDAHSVLGFILTFQCKIGELSRMTQFKLKSASQKDGVDAGLFVYPPLMAADILLYDTAVVPVGADQRQHVELTRDIGERFNKRYGETFKLPDYYLAPIGNKIMNLADPSKKMSKSDSGDKGTVFLLEDLSAIRKKIMSAVTDDLAHVHFDEKKQPGISNLMSIMACISGKTFKEIEAQFEGKGYGDFKRAVADLVCELIGDIQEKFKQFNNPKTVRELLARGKAKAEIVANEKIKEVKENLGLTI